MMGSAILASVAGTTGSSTFSSVARGAATVSSGLVASVVVAVAAEVASAMVSDKVRHIKDTQAEYVTAGDSSCLMNIGGALSRQHMGIRSVHMAEILASTKEHPLTPTSAVYKKEKML